jgi:Hypothetical glycosyl hydrolase 6/Beta-galactosidase trimerisation domain
MRYRQIHLDFHTSGLIPGIGSAFDAEDFAASLKDANVDSVTLFSKCHHGYSYHPTRIGRMHPGLKFDLLRAQIDALHAVDIKAPIYLSATWDEFAASEHPEWRIVSPDGHLPQSRNDPTGWAFLDFSSPYLDYLVSQVEEVMQIYPDGDGIFMDISFQLPTTSVFARRKMDAMGLDWTDKADCDRFSEHSVEEYYRRITEIVRQYNPDTPLFFNSGHVRRGNRAHYKTYYSHLELESLPTAGWGYDHFPLSARYVDPQGIPFLGMTGKFHFTWGEIGGYKRPEALVYECGAMLAHGARCSIGDHLHPTGKIDPSTMGIIKPAYTWVKDRESWVVGSVNRAEIALLSEESTVPAALAASPDRKSNADDGACRVLLEGGFTFDVVDQESDYSPYRLLILPDSVVVNAALKARIEAYVAKGGKVLLTGKSGVDPQDGFVFDVGAQWQGTSEMKGGDYVLPITPLQADEIDMPLFMYLPSERINVTHGASLGEVYDPYFDRTARHFSGHINIPCQPEPSGYAAGVENGGYIYMAHPLFSAYFQVGAVRMLEMAESLILYALDRPKLVDTNLPRAGRVTVRHQPEYNRDIVHLLHATPALRGELWNANIQPIQDIIPLMDTVVSVEIRGTVQSVRLVPENMELPFRSDFDRIEFTVPRFCGHAMIEIQYANDSLSSSI